MKYWNEICPNCGFSKNCSDVNNNKGYGSPLIACDNCKKPYIDPKRIELAFIPKYEWKEFLIKTYLRNLLLPIFPTIFVWLIIAIIDVKGKTDQPLESSIATIIGIIIYIVILLIGIIKTAATLKKELKASKERMEIPGYKKMLQLSGYDPKY